MDFVGKDFPIDLMPRKRERSEVVVVQHWIQLVAIVTDRNKTLEETLRYNSVNLSFNDIRYGPIHISVSALGNYSVFVHFHFTSLSHNGSLVFLIGVFHGDLIVAVGENVDGNSEA